MGKNLFFKHGRVKCFLILTVAIILLCAPFYKIVAPQFNDSPPIVIGGYNDRKNDDHSSDNSGIDYSNNNTIDQLSRILAPGLYNNSGELIASWNVLVAQYGFDCEKDYTPNDLFTDAGSLFSVICKNNEFVYGAMLVVDDDVARIGDGALALHPNLHTVIVPDSVTSIGLEAFVECTALKNVVFQGTTERWRTLTLEEGWCNYTSAIEVTCSNGTIPILVDLCYGFFSSPSGEYAYCGKANPTNRTYIKIKSEVLDRRDNAWTIASIEANAFKDFKTVNTVIIPASIIEIGNSAFSGCENLTTIVFEGTTEQWNTIKLGQDWNYKVPATHIQCLDGIITINQ